MECLLEAGCVLLLDLDAGYTGVFISKAGAKLPRFSRSQRLQRDTAG